MHRAHAILLLMLGLFASCRAGYAQQQPPVQWTIQSEGGVQYEFGTGLATATNALVQYGNAVLTAERVAVNQNTGEVIADGRVRLQMGEEVWASEHLSYNFKSQKLQAAQFRTGEMPVFAAGSGLQGESTNGIYTATARGAVITSEDISEPGMKLRAKEIQIIPGKKIKAYDAVLYLWDVPVFYFPYYSRNIGPHANNFNFTPGYRSLFGPFILGNYTWYLNDELDGVMRLDYRQRRGVGAGPDFNYHLGRWGDGTFRYYYTHDEHPELDGLGIHIPEDRQRVLFSYQSNPETNLFLKALVRYESDPAVVRDFFESEYVHNPQPNTFFDANKFWDNWSVDAYAQPRLNSFLQTVERLPEIRLTGFRQEIGASPVYYESESSAGYYRQLFAENAGPYGAPPGLDYSAARADTYHQLLLPETFFGWLNVTPRVGGRFTYYSEASGPGATTDEQYRGVFNTGAEVGFKASRLWQGVQSDLLQVDGLRHIIEPSANYVFVPSPTVAPNQLPQFDYELPSLRLLPLDFPDYNAIDSIDSQNVIRWGLRNRLQTKRDGAVVDLVDWQLYSDWRIKPRSDQTTFSDLYSDLTVRPRQWLALESLTRFDIHDSNFRMAFHTLTIQPNSIWSWRIGHYFLRDDISPSPTALGLGNNVMASTMYYRLNENWGFRMGHYFDARSGKLREQSYTVYRDMRSWTAALTFLIRDYLLGTNGPQDYTIAFTFSLKAFPHFGMGAEAGGPYSLLGM